MFIDLAEIYVKAGDGGNGRVSFHREKYVAAGGPDGGDGGDGGNLIFQADKHLRTLADFRYRRSYKSERGEDGGQKKCFGKKGSDLVIKVPCGTLVRDKETGLILADITKDGQTEIIAKGGKGGKGNVHFATPTRQIPNFAKNGTPGEERWIILELKLLADVGLVGYPNVGKSTLLAAVSSATPKIANYHFTTLSPNLGVVSMGEGESFVIADIPGLIEGAHEGVGLGHDFLRHVERTRILVHVIDIASLDGRDPVEDFHTINNELEKYNPELAKRPQIIAANKVDVLANQDILKGFTASMEQHGYKVFPISAATGTGVQEMVNYVYEQVKTLPEPIVYEPAPKEMLYKAETEEPFTVEVIDEVYVVDGPWIRGILRGVNFEDRESLQYFQRALRQKGVIRALEEKGVHEGDTVRVGEDTEFEYIP
ncbi:MAG: GTPase ObgE [Thermoclostridium sp.]|nr:GTPase ObgE [Thermoclostridium sp.]